MKGKLVKLKGKDSIWRIMDKFRSEGRTYYLIMGVHSQHFYTCVPSEIEKLAYAN